MSYKTQLKVFPVHYIFIILLVFFRSLIFWMCSINICSILQKDYDKLAFKMTQQNKAYNDLQPQYDRIKVADFGREQTKQANAGARRYKDSTSNTIAKTSNSDIIESDNLVQRNIDSGNVKLEINPEKQSRHIKDSKGYVEGRSYIYGGVEQAQKIVNDLHGTGTPVKKPDGTWANKEHVQSDKPIGIAVSKQTGEEETKEATIHYSKTGTHVVLRKEE